MAQETTSRSRIRLPRIGAMLVNWLRRNAGAFAVLFGIISVWEAYARLVTQNNAYLPSASFTVEQTAEHWETVMEGIRVTFAEILLGFFLAVLVGVTLGIIIAESFVIRQLTMPMLVFAYAIPHAILAPVFLIWFGTGLRGVGVFAAWLAFFPTFLNTLTGISTVHPDMEKLGDIVGTTRWQRLRYLTFWNALPGIISGIKISLQMTVVGVIVAEFLVTDGGLGYVIIRSTQRAQLGLTFGTVIIIGLFAIVIFKAVSYALESLNPHRA